jgi:hypothetical protein
MLRCDQLNSIMQINPRIVVKIVDRDIRLLILRCVVTAGLSTAAYFCGHATLHLVDVFVQPAIFLSVYYTLTLPEIRFVDYYVGETYVITSCTLSFHV